MNNRSLLRKEAKVIYKNNIKGIKKSQRLPFKLFFKQFVEAKKLESEAPAETIGDFDFDNMVNLNDISLPEKDEATTDE